MSRAYDAEVSYLHMPPEVEEDDTVPLAPVFSGSNRSDLNYKYVTDGQEVLGRSSRFWPLSSREATALTSTTSMSQT